MCGYSFICQHSYFMTVSQCTVIQEQSQTMVSGKGESFSSFFFYLMKVFSCSNTEQGWQDSHLKCLLKIVC